MRSRLRAKTLGLFLGAACLWACEAHEVPVFELRPLLGGASGTGGGSSGNGGTAGVSSGNGGTAGMGLGVGGNSGRGGASGSAGELDGGEGSVGASGSGNEGGSGEPAASCESAADCMPNWQCDKVGCEAVTGLCKPPPPVFCPSEPSPVCGCDGITYWNDCIRRQVGTPLAAKSECSVTACACEVDADCKQEGASCAHLVQGADMCRGGGPGACWVLPPKCMPNPGDPPVWQECRPPDAPPAPCVDTCLAIRSGWPHKKRFDQCMP